MLLVLLRADYWISQNRKYCDFCKCWITDNKPSIDFHEKGRRHQENVKKKLRNISKHSSQVQKDANRVDVTLQQMELAALEAYKKDMEHNGGDLTSTVIRQNVLKEKGITKVWNEAKTRDGQTYYVNIMTKETVWQPPQEGFLSLEEQREQAENEAQKQLKALEKYKRKEGLLMMQKVQQEEAEEAARKMREKLKERKVADDLTPVNYCPLLEPGKTDPYGKWQTVKEREVVDLQLPTQEYWLEPELQYEPEPVVKEFKEKTVESLGDGETSFKKRKFGVGAKRNVRQRLSDE